MSLKARLFRFTRTASVIDLRTDAVAQKLADIRRKALRYATLNHTCGMIAAFN